MKIGTCPSCAGPVKFRAASSVVAICEYCTSTLVRNGEALENIGRMAALQDDPTLIQIGTEGSHKGVHFGVIGRIQLRYEDGLWNEWYLLFDDMKIGWLGEAGGEFYVTFEKPVAAAPPSYSAIEVGDHIDLGQADTEGPFEVSNLESATCIAGQGELPFTVGPGFAAPVVDLRRGTQFATIDYSDAAVRVYLGERVDARSLKFGNLRDPALRNAGAGGFGIAEKMDLSVLKCPGCAAPFKLSSKGILTYACPGCRSILDTANNTVKLVAKAQEAMSYPMRLPLNSTGALDKIKWEVIGHVRRGMPGEGAMTGFSWSEYLLYEPKEGYRWLVESDGHWSFVRNAEKLPVAGGSTVVYDGESYNHFQSYDAEVLHVLGEFYWRVKVGDRVKVNDYVTPPRIISAERTEKELTWSAGRYVTPDEVQAAFALKSALPAPRGIASNQPSPWAQTTASVWKYFVLFSALALVVQLFFALRSETVHVERFSIAPGEEKVVTTKQFLVKGASSNVVVNTETDLDNGSMELSYILVNPESGKSWRSDRELAHYSGYDDGESWSEGERSNDTVFPRVPAGKYLLNISTELPKEAKRAVTGKLKVERGHPSWINWIALQVLLLLLPLFAAWRSRAFEIRRWADSDHPRVTESGSDED